MVYNRPKRLPTSFGGYLAQKKAAKYIEVHSLLVVQLKACYQREEPENHARSSRKAYRAISTKHQ